MGELTHTKVCFVCGREYEADSEARHREEAADGDYCSDTCRQRGLEPLDFALEGALLRLLRSRPYGSSVSAWDAAREAHPRGWRRLKERTRRAARRLVALGEIEILQNGRPIDPTRARGDIEVRLRRRNAG